MSSSQYTYYKNIGAKWLVGLTLLLSLFSFAGFNTGHYAQAPHILKTEILASVIGRHKGTVAYNKAFFLSTDKLSVNISLKAFTKVLYRYNKLIAVKLTQISKQFLACRPTNRFFRLLIRQSSEESNAHSCPGKFYLLPA